MEEITNLTPIENLHRIIGNPQLSSVLPSAVYKDERGQLVLEHLPSGYRWQLLTTRAHPAVDMERTTESGYLLSRSGRQVGEDRLRPKGQGEWRALYSVGSD